MNKKFFVLLLLLAIPAGAQILAFFPVGNTHQVTQQSFMVVTPSVMVAPGSPQIYQTTLANCLQPPPPANSNVPPPPGTLMLCDPVAKLAQVKDVSDRADATIRELCTAAGAQCETILNAHSIYLIVPAPAQ
jgi:hypothetical protein